MDRKGLLEAVTWIRRKLVDVDDTVEDMLLPPRKRALGHVLHERNYEEARGSIDSSLDYLDKQLADDGDHGDPSGNGGAGPAH